MLLITSDYFCFTIYNSKLKDELVFYETFVTLLVRQNSLVVLFVHICKILDMQMPMHAL